MRVTKALLSHLSTETFFSDSHILQYYIKSIVIISSLYPTYSQNVFIIHIITLRIHQIYFNPIGGVMVSVLSSSMINREFEPRSCQTKNYEISICCFSAKHASSRSKSKYWLAQNVPEWGDMSICGLLFQWASTMQNPTQYVGLVHSGPHLHLIEN